ncbi:SSI family serine proteinase inhibitor [Streptomyces sp. CC219B]|uniref:SSI family serine proteinase inhibitor n=1 Tax=Streptomyces sp. CC219B TaxID=3044574 RepID=UPI0024A87D7D|nr:SSI family serine proteinase inhibitor [Streptomyces sp. CC219B]
MTLSTTATAARVGMLAAAALLLAGAAPAQAAERDSLPGNWLYLTLTTGDDRSSDTRGTLLMCNPPQGHSHAAEACAQLASVDGDITALPQLNVPCPMIYAPVTAHAHGQWNGRPVEYTQTYSNACAMKASTGSVFALDT